MSFVRRVVLRVRVGQVVGRVFRRLSAGLTVRWAAGLSVEWYGWPSVGLSGGLVVVVGCRICQLVFFGRVCFCRVVLSCCFGMDASSELLVVFVGRVVLVR